MARVLHGSEMEKRKLPNYEGMRTRKMKPFITHLLNFTSLAGNKTRLLLMIFSDICINEYFCIVTYFEGDAFTADD